MDYDDEGPQEEFSRRLLEDKYAVVDGEDHRGVVRRVAAGLTEPGRERAELEDLLGDQRFLPAGRIMAAIGAPKAVTPYNCFVSGTIPDSFVTRDNPEKSSIMHRAEQAAATMRMGGGIGYNFGTLRPDGALIEKLMSKSNGPLAFMPVFDAVCRATSSAGNRRGAQMGVLPVWHPDIRAYIAVKNNISVLTGFNLSIAITDDFMNALARGSTYDLRFGGQVYETVDAAELWHQIMESTHAWAEPGVLYIDQINRRNNLWYCEEITATNPCFSGDTKVWTDRGHFRFDELVGKTVNVLSQNWDGRLVYRPMSNIRITEKKARMVEVKFTDGQTVRCTPNHLFFLRGGGQMEAGRLQPGTSIQSVYRYNANSKGYKKVSNGVEVRLEHHVPFEDGVPVGYDVHHLDEIKTHNWAENLELIEHGAHSTMHMTGDRNPMRRYPERNHFLTKDFGGENNGRWRHDLNTLHMIADREAGMSFSSIAEKHGCSKYTAQKRVQEANHTVESVTVLGIDAAEDVYCGTVDEFHRFFVALGDDDGVLVHNCGEQPLPPFGACLLGSFNLVKYLVPRVGGGYDFDWEWLASDVPTAVRALDRVIDVALYPLPEQELEAKSKRRMGIGVTGLANALEAMGHHYGSPGFVEIEHRILHLIQREAYLEGTRLARRLGRFPLFDTDRFCSGQHFATLDPDVRREIELHGLRNSHYTSIAPTGTISMTADNVSSSVEPVIKWHVKRDVIMPEGKISVPLYDYGFKYLRTRGRRSAYGEITAREHVAVLCAAQTHVDSAVSKTVIMDGSMPFEDFKGIYWSAYEGGAKGCTTYNVDGKRAGLFKHEVEPADLPMPGEIAGSVPAYITESVEMSCTWDPATGRRSCE